MPCVKQTMIEKYATELENANFLILFYHSSAHNTRIGILCTAATPRIRRTLLSDVAERRMISC